MNRCVQSDLVAIVYARPAGSNPLQIEKGAGAYIAMAAHIKSSAAKKALKSPELLDMFQAAIGGKEGGTDAAATRAKYNKMREHTGRFVRTLAAMEKAQLMAPFPSQAADLAGYVAALSLQHAEDFPDVPEGSPEFGAAFARAKASNLVKVAVVACEALVQYKTYLSDASRLSDRFILRAASTCTIAPLPNLSLDFRRMYIDDRTDAEGRAFLLLLLHKIYTVGHAVYDASTLPDVDVDEFVRVIMSSIKDVKKRIPRCELAFSKITESVETLKGNFSGYYKEYTASGNPSVIMENFVLDVAKNTKSSATLTSQFRTIVAHFHKVAAQKPANAKLQSVFAHVTNNLDALDRASAARAAPDASGGADDSDDDSDDSAEDVATGESSASAAASTATASTATASTASTATAPASTATAPTRSARRHVMRKAKRAAAKRLLAASATGDTDTCTTDAHEPDATDAHEPDDDDECAETVATEMDAKTVATEMDAKTVATEMDAKTVAAETDAAETDAAETDAAETDAAETDAAETDAKTGAAETNAKIGAAETGAAEETETTTGSKTGATETGAAETGAAE